MDCSPPGSPVHGISRQEHWSGLPVPSPMHESEKWKWSRSVMADSQWPHGLQPTKLLRPWDSPGKNTGVGCHALLQGIFSTQGSNPSLPHCRQILYHLSHQRGPRILEQLAYPFSRGSSWPRNRTRVSCIAGTFFTSWATRKALFCAYLTSKYFQ